MIEPENQVGMILTIIKRMRRLQTVKGCVLEDKELRLHVKIFFPKFYYP